MIISFRQLPPENKAVNIHSFEEPLKNLKAVNLNGRMFWFYGFAPLDVHKFYPLYKYKWGF
jgi:hypothetical protein